MSDIVPARPYRITPTGVLFSRVLSFEEWRACESELWDAKQAVQWAYGDWLIEGEAKFGEQYAEALDEARYSYQSLRNLKWIASVYPREQRLSELSWSHHSEVAGLPEPLRTELLLRAASEGWSRDDLRMERKKLEAQTIIEPLSPWRSGGKVTADGEVVPDVPPPPEWWEKRVTIVLKEA